MANIIIEITGITGAAVATHGVTSLNLPYWACKALKKWAERTYKYVTGATVTTTITSNAKTSNFTVTGNEKYS